MPRPPHFDPLPARPLASESPSDLVELFARAAARAPGRIALRYLVPTGERTLDYGELTGAAARVADELTRRGLRRGDRVAFWLASGPELAVAWLATLACGAAMVPIHLAYTRREVAHILGDAEPRLMIVGREQLAGIEELDPTERASVEAVLVAEELLSPAALERATVAPDSTSPFAARVELAPSDLALLLYTSGTTGRSKGAMLSHGNVVAMIRSLHEAWRWSADDALLLALPLFHLHGLVVGLACALAAGAEVVLEERFDAARAVARLERGDATLFFGVPTLYVRLAEELARNRRTEGAARFPRVRLFVSGSAPLDPETFAAFRAATGVEILERYGMTETGMLLGNPLDAADGPRRAGTVGRPLPGVEMRLVDDAGAPVAPGGDGEIEVRGPSVFAGYWRAPEKTAESFRADAQGRLWFRTGDRGRVDPADGSVSLLGRASELILSGGFNVYPREIEEVLLRLPGVREAAVVGEPHPEFGESPVAFLVVDRELGDDELSAHCRVELARFKLPRRYVRVDALPRNALGKVEKRKLLAAGPGAGAIA